MVSFGNFFVTFESVSVTFGQYTIHNTIHIAIIGHYCKNILAILDIFHLVTLIAGLSKPFMMIESGYEKTQSYHKISSTYEVTNVSNGFLIDLINDLASVCNFTYEVHIRKDKKFGNIIESANGSAVFTGFYKTLLDPKGMI